MSATNDEITIEKREYYFCPLRLIFPLALSQGAMLDALRRQKEIMEASKCLKGGCAWFVEEADECSIKILTRPVLSG